MPTKNERKCYYCDKYFDITQEEYVKPRLNRYAHKSCFEKYSTPDDVYIEKIYEYLKDEIKVKYDYLACERQRVNFINKLGYTNKGIYYSLKFFYEVKKQSPEKSGNRIGIVPYVYDEAKEYYKQLSLKQRAILKVVEGQKNIEHIEIYVEKTPQRRKKLIDLTTIEGINNDR